MIENGGFLWWLSQPNGFQICLRKILHQQHFAVAPLEPLM
jgi:hypothetical protein